MLNYMLSLTVIGGIFLMSFFYSWGKWGTEVIRKTCSGFHPGSLLNECARAGGVLLAVMNTLDNMPSVLEFRYLQNSLGLLLNHAVSWVPGPVHTWGCELTAPDSFRPGYCQLLGGVPTQSSCPTTPLTLSLQPKKLVHNLLGLGTKLGVDFCVLFHSWLENNGWGFMTLLCCNTGLERIYGGYTLQHPTHTHTRTHIMLMSELPAHKEVCCCWPGGGIVRHGVCEHSPAVLYSVWQLPTLEHTALHSVTVNYATAELNNGEWLGERKGQTGFQPASEMWACRPRLLGSWQEEDL